jgi:hypothetical protein
LEGLLYVVAVLGPKFDAINYIGWYLSG